MKMHFIKLIVCMSVLTGCATFNAQKIGPTPIDHAQHEIPEEELLDVGIAVFSSENLTIEDAKKKGTLPGIQKAESHYIPYHLKNTLQQSSHWGMVRVTPTESDAADVLIKGRIIESNGENLIVEINATDSSGKTWMKKTYKSKISKEAYQENQIGKKDAFQDLYNTIANDIAAHKATLDLDRIKVIRAISELKFAEDMAPDAFGNYLQNNRKNVLTINRLPADDDPMMKRILKIRERDYMFVDTLNRYYESFYNEMWSPYENWRRLNLAERIARSKVKREALLRQAAGALLVATAIFLDAKNVDNTGLLQGLLVVSGGKIFIDGVNISKQAGIHAAAIEELSESFDNEMKPSVIEFEGKQYELTGSAEDQYKRWRELLRQIYYEETGFGESVLNQ
jgi:hypothetical protein